MKASLNRAEEHFGRVLQSRDGGVFITRQSLDASCWSVRRGRVLILPESGRTVQTQTQGDKSSIPAGWGDSKIPRSFFFFPFFIRYLAHLHFQCYTKSPPYPPTPTPLPTHSPFLALAFPCTGAYKVCKSNGPLFPVMAD
jgi:hypothetical protein